MSRQKRQEVKHLYLSGLLGSLWSIFKSITLVDVFDIALLSLIIFKLIQIIRETRAVQLAKGIFVLVAVYIIAKAFDLAVLRWVLTVVFNSAIVALAVIFQPELRRMLEKIGQINLGANRVLDSEQERTKEAVDS